MSTNTTNAHGNPEYFQVVNWEKFRGDRNGQWFKLYKPLPSDVAFSELTDMQKFHLINIWMFSDEGKIPNRPKLIQRRMGLSRPPDLMLYLDRGFLEIYNPEETNQ